MLQIMSVVAGLNAIMGFAALAFQKMYMAAINFLVLTDAVQVSSATKVEYVSYAIQKTPNAPKVCNAAAKTAKAGNVA
ncbi:MAG: hypothetical protein QXT25_00895 [Candidatus Anstonellaceae archaeon]